jgi:hypothetical protein
MHPFQDFQYLWLAEVGFTAWMLVDAYRRQADWFWFWIILILQPVGPWIYFFAVKISDFRSLRGLSWFQPRTSLEELRYQAERVPTLASHLALAERLIERKEFAEALPHLEAARAREPEHCQVLYGLAVCSNEQGHPDQAMPLLEQIVARDRRWSDYSAWRLLVAARVQTGDRPGALTACRELVRLAPTLQHQCLLAENLLADGGTQEAHTLLTQALETYRFAPGPSRRRNHRWAKEAKALLKRVPS